MIDTIFGNRLRACGLFLAIMGLFACTTVPLVPGELPVSAVAPATVTAPRLALVLGGGATRGFAHVGVIKALEANGIRPDLIVGTSAGSFVGALYAGGVNADELRRIALALEESELRDMTFPNRGVVKGELIQEFINRELGNRSIEALPVRFVAVATDLATGEEVAFTQGNTGMAVRASSSIPGLFQPVNINGHDYVDGGLVSPLPVAVARRLGAMVVVAVNISRRPSDAPVLESTLDVLLQTMAIMGHEVAKHQALMADVVVEPRLQIIGRQGFLQREEAIAEGEAALQRVLPRIQSLLRTAGAHP